MDICTLVVASTMTLLGCIVPNVCHERDNVQYCQPDYSKSCPSNVSEPYWSCQRPDGLIYVKKRLP